ncbi:MAG: PH domain-containing protein, partial [Pseudomonadota bacterium]
INLSQSIFGRIFGYGQLTLRGTGVGVIELPNLDSPIKVRRTIETAKADLRRSGLEEFRGEE